MCYRNQKALASQGAYVILNAEKGLGTNHCKAHEPCAIMYAACFPKCDDENRGEDPVVNIKMLHSEKEDLRSEH